MMVLELMAIQHVSEGRYGYEYLGYLRYLSRTVDFTLGCLDNTPMDNVHSLPSSGRPIPRTSIRRPGFHPVHLGLRK